MKYLAWVIVLGAIVPPTLLAQSSDEAGSIEVDTSGSGLAPDNLLFHELFNTALGRISSMQIPAQVRCVDSALTQIREHQAMLRGSLDYLPSWEDRAVVNAYLMHSEGVCMTLVAFKEFYTTLELIGIPDTTECAFDAAASAMNGVLGFYINIRASGRNLSGALEVLPQDAMTHAQYITAILVTLDKRLQGIMGPEALNIVGHLEN